jgi:DNA-binding NtrC family response regulator
MERHGMPAVLIVDDEAVFRGALAKLLRRRGFQTLEADSGDAALGLIANPEADVAVVLTDVKLPRTSGLELADRIKKLAPKVGVFLMSGYPLRTLEREYGISKDLISFFITKPFDVEVLAARIREALGV